MTELVTMALLVVAAVWTVLENPTKKRPFVRSASPVLSVDMLASLTPLSS